MRFPSSVHTNQSRCGGATPWLALALILGVATVVGVWQTPRRINHDCANYIHLAEMVLDGEVLYCGTVDVNPPLSTYLYVPVVWLAQKLCISPIVVFQAGVLALLFASAAEMLLLLRKQENRMQRAEQGGVILVWMALFLLVDWHGDVGQREHLFMLTYVPYLFLRILRYRRGSVSLWFAVLLGFQAGVGVSLKPHFLLGAAAVEVVLVLATRRWRAGLRPECIVLAGVVAAYVAHWLVVPTAMREAFFHRWVPLICRGYRSYDASYSDIAGQVLMSPFLAAGLVGVAAAAILLLARRRLRLRLHLLAYATLAIAGMAMFCFQHKGFTYHFIPYETAALLCLLMAGLSATKPERASAVNSQLPRTTWGTIAARYLLLGMFAAVVATWLVERPNSARPDTPDYAALRQIVAERTRPGDRVLVLASSTRPAYPMLVQLDCHPSSRYLTSCMLAFFYAGVQPVAGQPIYHRYDEAPAEERHILDDYRDDVERYQPRLIIVNDSPGWFGLPDDFNMFEYLVYCGWAKRSLAPYREIAGPQGWKVFVRKSSAETMATRP
jgi:hypothetical protein